jgi:hypothetical protein
MFGMLCAKMTLYHDAISAGIRVPTLTRVQIKINSPLYLLDLDSQPQFTKLQNSISTSFLVSILTSSLDTCIINQTNSFGGSDLSSNISSGSWRLYSAFHYLRILCKFILRVCYVGLLTAFITAMACRHHPPESANLLTSSLLLSYTFSFRHFFQNGAALSQTRNSVISYEYLYQWRSSEFGVAGNSLCQKGLH